MSFIIRNNKISKILFIITISIILFSISLNVKAAENKIEIKDGNQIITDTTGTLKTPKVLNVNTNVEKKLTINYVGVDNNRLDYNLEEKEGNLDFDVNVLTGEIKLKAKSGTNFGAVFSLVDRQTKKVYPISLVIRAIDGKSKVSLLGSVKNMKFNTISGNMYLEGIADLKRVIEGGINPLNEKPTMYLKNLNIQRTVELSVEKVSTYEYRFRIKAEDMAEDDKYTIHVKISKQNTYADNSSLERQLTIERAVPNTIENNRYRLTNSDDNISINIKPVTYNLNANLVDIYGFNRGQNDYVIGNADIFLKDNDGNRVKPREVKIYAEKNGNKTYFNVYNNRYDFELLLNSVEAGEYTIYAEATGNNGKTYKEKLNISQGLRKNLTVSGMQTEARTGESKLVLTKKNKEKEPNYIIRTNTNNMYGFHRADGNDYIIGTADIFLSDENGNRVKPREVKIYAEKNGNKTYFNVDNDRYDFELLLNNVEAGEYTIYAEAMGNNGKTYREKLWIGGHLRKNITVSGMQTEARVEEGRIILKKKGEPNYIIRTNTNSMYGFHRADGNDYIIGTADIFLSDENGNRVKPREVKIYAEKDGNKTYFNVYNDRYDFELLLNNVEAGEYTIYAEAAGNNGKTYSEKLWIGSGLRRDITVNGMKKVAIISNNLLIEKREKDIEYVLEQPELVALVDERQYIYGNLIVKLKEISNNSYTGIRNVKIYAEKDGVKNQFYVKNIGNERYYYDFIINHLKNFENYNIYIEVEDNNGRIYRRGLDFSKLRKNRLTVRGFNRKVNLQGTNMYIEQTNNEEVDFEQGIYGQSGLKVKGDSRGQDLRYYKFGNGKNVFYATFALHGFEDLWNNDGKELTYIAERFKDYLIRIGKSNIFKDWTLYLFPQVNPDGTNHGWTNNGPGRTTLYSSAPGNRGIDLNRNFRAEGTEHTKFTGDRNYNGERGFEAYEAKFLSEFIKATQSKNGKNVLVDTHRMAWRNYRR